MSDKPSTAEQIAALLQVARIFRVDIGDDLELLLSLAPLFEVARKMNSDQRIAALKDPQLLAVLQRHSADG